MNRSRIALPLTLSLLLLSGAALVAASSATEAPAPPGPAEAAPAVAPTAPAPLESLFTPAPVSLAAPVECIDWETCEACPKPGTVRVCTHVKCNGQTTTRCSHCVENACS
jgi:hypothetical protein